MKLLNLLFKRIFLVLFVFILLGCNSIAAASDEDIEDGIEQGVIMSGFPTSVKLGEEFTGKITFENPEEALFDVKYSFSFERDLANFDYSTSDYGSLVSDICGLNHIVRFDEYNSVVLGFSEDDRSYTSYEKFVSNIGGTVTWKIVVSFRNITKTFSRTVRVISNYKPQSFISFSDLGNKQAQIDYSPCSADNKANVYDDYISKIESKIVSEFSEDTLCFVYNFEKIRQLMIL